MKNLVIRTIKYKNKTHAEDLLWIDATGHSTLEATTTARATASVAAATLVASCWSPAAQMTIVRGALVGITQDRVRLTNALKLRRRIFLILSVPIRMPLHCELPIRSLDRFGIRVFRDSQGFVVAHYPHEEVAR